MLYDQQCSDKENRVWPQFECKSDKECSDMADLLNKNLGGDPFGGLSVDLTMVGMLRNRHKSGRRYAFQGGVRWRLTFTA
jgi:hypothetical protein